MQKKNYFWQLFLLIIFINFFSNATRNATIVARFSYSHDRASLVKEKKFDYF